MIVVGESAVMVRDFQHDDLHDCFGGLFRA